MIDRSRVGFRTAPTTAAVDGWRVKLFCQAIGETDAVYFILFTQQFGVGRLSALQTRFIGVAKLGDSLQLSASLVTVENGVGHYELRARTATGTELVSGTARVAASATVGKALT